MPPIPPFAMNGDQNHGRCRHADPVSYTGGSEVGTIELTELTLRDASLGGDSDCKHRFVSISEIQNYTNPK